MKTKIKLLIVDDLLPTIRDVKDAIQARKPDWDIVVCKYLSDAMRVLVETPIPDFCIIDLQLNLGSYPTSLQVHLWELRNKSTDRNREGQVLGLYCEKHEIPFLYLSNYPGSVDREIHDSSDPKVFSKSVENYDTLINYVEQRIATQPI